MAYERDSDRATRGVGAVAAADMASPARHMRRVQQGIATRRRDRAMVALGSVTPGYATVRPLRAPVRPQMVDHRTPDHGASNPQTAPPAEQPAGQSFKVIMTTSGATVVRPRIPTTVPVPVPVNDTGLVPPPLPTTAPPPKQVVSVSGGGGAGVSPSRSASVPLPTIPMPDLPDIPDAPSVQDNTVRNAVIIGGGLVAAYLVWSMTRRAA